MDPNLLPPKLDKETAPRIVGSPCLASTKIEANYKWDIENKAHLGAPCGARFGLQILRMPTHENLRQVQFQIDLLEHPGAAVPNSYLGSLIEFVNVEFPKPEGLTADIMDQAAAWVSTNMLVGVARAHLDLITAIGPFPRVTLSPVSQQAVVAGARVIKAVESSPEPLYPSAEKKSPAAEK